MVDQSDVANIDSSLIDYYAKLREHRCRVTEGIRVIAFRNMDHLTTAQQYVGVRKFSSEADIIAVQNKMLEEIRAWNRATPTVGC